MERPSMKDRDNLHFTEACIFETMRLGSFTGLCLPHMTICDSQVGKYLHVCKQYNVPILHLATNTIQRFSDNCINKKLLNNTLKI
jgi:hypothetical protein